jgi:ankyrin repeat protein
MRTFFFLLSSLLLPCMDGAAQAVVAEKEKEDAPAPVALEDLWEAVQSNDAGDILRLMIVAKDGNIINEIGPGGQTPLMNAVLLGFDNSVKTLLQLGADVTIPEKDGYTPMHGAGFQGRAVIAQLLLDHGLDPLDPPHTDGYVGMHRACWGKEQRHTDTVQVFLNAGVGPNLLAGNGKTCLQMTRNPATRKLLEEHANSSAGETKTEL